MNVCDVVFNIIMMDRFNRCCECRVSYINFETMTFDCEEYNCVEEFDFKGNWKISIVSIG